MKKLLSTLFLFCLIVSAAYAGFTERSEPYLVKHFKSTAGKELNVTTAGGHIQVIGARLRYNRHGYHSLPTLRHFGFEVFGPKSCFANIRETDQFFAL